MLTATPLLVLVMTGEVKTYRALKIITMDGQNPGASHVAVRAGKILAVGGKALESKYGEADAVFAEHILVPGFVEAHAHASEGMIWKLPYVGFYDRMHPDGQVFRGCTTVDALVARLVELEQALATQHEALFAWGYDSIYFSDKPMRRDLDRVSTSRPVVLFHTSLHLITVNSVALELAGITRDNRVEGVYVDDAGEPNGELAEVAAMFPVLRVVGDPVFDVGYAAEDVRRFGRACHRAGITTASDLYSDLEPDVLDTFDAVTREPDFPARIVPALATTRFNLERLRGRLTEISGRGHDRLYLGSVKIVTDGAIAGFSARVRQPYLNGIENGVWYEAPQKIREMIRALHPAGVRLHIHVNGDEASELVLQIFEEVVAASGPRQRHVLEHAQMMDADQLARAKRLGLVVNFFANHTYYWGDQHRDATVGAEIAARMNPARTALDLGLDVALHSDAPVTPLGPLFCMWCAVNRHTATGRDLGPEQRISPAEALRAVTLAPAIGMGMDDRVGSISPGKYADFTLLDRDPLGVEPMRIRDIRVLGTMLGGAWQPAVSPSASR